MFRSDSGFFDFDEDDDDKVFGRKTASSSTCSLASIFESEVPSPKAGAQSVSFGVHGVDVKSPTSTATTLTESMSLSGNNGSQPRRCPSPPLNIERRRSSTSSDSDVEEEVVRRRRVEVLRAELQEAKEQFPELSNFPKGLSVLLVEDIVVSGQLVSRILTNAGYNVSWCKSVNEAYALFKRASCSFHLILGAKRVLKNVLSYFRGLPVILMSSAQDVPAMARCAIGGCVAACLKTPLDFEDVQGLWRYALSYKVSPNGKRIDVLDMDSLYTTIRPEEFMQVSM